MHSVQMKNSAIHSNKLATELDLPAGRFFIATDYTNKHKSVSLISYSPFDFSSILLDDAIEKSVPLGIK